MYEINLRDLSVYGSEEKANIVLSRTLGTPNLFLLFHVTSLERGEESRQRIRNTGTDRDPAHADEIWQRYLDDPGFIDLDLETEFPGEHAERKKFFTDPAYIFAWGELNLVDGFEQHIPRAEGNAVLVYRGKNLKADELVPLNCYRFDPDAVTALDTILWYTDSVIEVED